MRFGYFDDERLEYVINRPDTPLPWINYLGYDNYFGIISNTAGGYSFYKDARLRRLTRYRYNNTPLDEGGRNIYIRDDAAAQPFYWSPAWQPTRTALDSYECRHGLGYTLIKSGKADIETQMRFFVPGQQNLEIWEIDVANKRSQPAELSLFAAVEFCLWDALDDANNFQRNYSIGEVEVADGIIYHKSEYRERRNHFAFLACSQPLAGFDTVRESFLGPYNGWGKPQAVESGHLSGSIACGWQPIGAQQVKLHLKAGETRKVIFLLGYHENEETGKFDPPASQTINKRTVLPIIEEYLEPQTAAKAFRAMQAQYHELLKHLQVNTPDLHTNRMVNIWNAYQVMVTFTFSRSASYFESGIGRGMGFRDCNQDLLGFMHLQPERARQRILDVAATQLPNGGAYHQYQTLTRRGNNDIGSGFNDDPLWLILAVAAYLKETGCWDILDEPVQYDNAPGSEEPLYDHLKRALQYTLDRLGPHGLPLIGRADWNDCLNLNLLSSAPGQSFQTSPNTDGKVAESLFIAGLFVLAADEMRAISQHLPAAAARHELSAQFNILPVDFIQHKLDEMEKAVWEAGWDGAWFRRAYDAKGKPIGSRQNDEGRLFIEPQGMCVMAGLGLENERARQALDSVAERLAGPNGIVLHRPAYTRYYQNLGEISSYPPGYKENGGVFCHTNPWIMIAEARIGRGDKAHDYYLRINPSAREELSEVHRCEPYVYAQMIAGVEAVKPGEAKNSWLTGTASWNYVAITQWILGIRPAWNGLEIAPVIPQSWDGFSAVRLFRGVFYHIEARRGGPGNEISLEVDGKPFSGRLVPLPTGKVKSVQVKVVIR